ncbi:MAG: dihydrodipicolinate synthase family protein, partial [Chloroflexi bacterium]|nr:dihydrodipicolinate synthase family protein [Chloroflexota bacterium]
PQLVAEIYTAFVAGDLARARQAQARLAPLRIAFDLGTFPVVIKEALAFMGICSGRAKAPVKPMVDARRAELKLILQNLGAL